MQVTPHRHPGPENCISAPCRSHLTSIQGSGCGSHLHAGPSSPHSRCRELHLSSTQVPSYLHQCLANCISPPFRSRLTSNSQDSDSCLTPIWCCSCCVSHSAERPSMRVPHLDMVRWGFSSALNTWLKCGWLYAWEITSIGFFCSVSQHNFTEVPSGVINENNTRPLGDHWTVHHTLEKMCSLEVR